MKKLLLSLMMLGFVNVSYALNIERSLKQEAHCCCEACEEDECCESGYECCESGSECCESNSECKDSECC